MDGESFEFIFPLEYIPKYGGDGEIRKDGTKFVGKFGMTVGIDSTLPLTTLSHG